jgi:GTPase
MTSGAPDAVILMVGANAGLIGMSKEHLAIALALGVPVCVVISKVSHLLGTAFQVRYQRSCRSI